MKKTPENEESAIITDNDSASVEKKEIHNFLPSSIIPRMNVSEKSNFPEERRGIIKLIPRTHPRSGMNSFGSDFEKGIGDGAYRSSFGSDRGGNVIIGLGQSSGSLSGFGVSNRVSGTNIGAGNGLIKNGVAELKSTIQTKNSGNSLVTINQLKEKDRDKPIDDDTPSYVADGITIPTTTLDVKLPKIDDSKIKFVSTKYPLIPRKGSGKLYTYANISWDDTRHEFIYNIVEHELSRENEELLERIKDFIQEKVDVDFTKLAKRDAVTYINSMFNDALNYFKIVNTEDVKDVMRYYIFRDFIGLEKLEPFMQDPYLEDISCDGIGIPLYIYHKDPRFGSMRTNRAFATKEEIDRFVIKVAERCGKSISVAKPLLDGTLPDGSRVQATLESDIARRGSNFTIRKFSEKPLTPVDLLKYGSCDLTSMAYFWLALEYGLSMMVSGGTASGKTTILNALSFFIKPQLKIVSIEDTAEIRLAHPHWISQVARVPIATSRKDIDLYELLRESLRQRPDYIVVGEVRGKEAYVLFQQMALGHGGLSTIHAENFSKLVDRLTTAPISLPASLIRNVDVVVFAERVKQKDKYLRRISSITEVAGYDRSTSSPIPNEIIKWNAYDDKFIVKGKSVVLKKIAKNAGLSELDIRNEFDDRIKVLCWLIKNKVDDYVKISSIFNLFYTSRDYLMERIGEEI